MPRAILVKTQEGKYLLAEEDTKPSLLSFAKTYRATLSLVTIRSKAKTIRKVVEALNSQGALPSQKPTVSHEVEIYVPPEPGSENQGAENTIIKKENYQEFLNQASTVKEYIKKQLMKGDSISLTSLQEWASKKEISLSKGGLSRHLQKVLDWAVGQGYSRVKEGRAYRIERAKRGEGCQI